MAAPAFPVQPVQIVKRPRKRTSFAVAKLSDLQYYQYRTYRHRFEDVVLGFTNKRDAGRFYRGLVQHLEHQAKTRRLTLDCPAAEVANDKILGALAERVGMWVAATGTPLKGLPGGDIHPSMWAKYYNIETDLPPPAAEK